MNTGNTHWDEARAERRTAEDLRRFRRGTCTLLPAGLDAERAWTAAWMALRMTGPAPSGACMDETVDVLEVLAVDAGAFRVRVRHVLDRDFASQYNATESHDVVFILRDAEVRVVSRSAVEG